MERDKCIKCYEIGFQKNNYTFLTEKRRIRFCKLKFSIFNSETEIETETVNRKA